MTKYLILIISVGVILAPCESLAESEDLTEILSRYTPAGWHLYEAVSQFTPQNLYEQINGRASFFHAYDVRRMTYAGYVKSVNPTQFIDLSVYDMGTATNAFGVFSSERSPSELPLDIGQSSYRTEANFFVWQGRYYIRLICSENSDYHQRIAMDLTRKLAERLPKSNEQPWPWGLTALPLKDRIANSIQYIRINAMGLDFMQNTYTARYNKNGAGVMVFLSRNDTVDDARTTVGRYVDYTLRYGKGVDRLKRDNVKLIVCNMGGNFDVVFQKNRLIGGALAVVDRELALRTAVDLWRQVPKE